MTTTPRLTYVEATNQVAQDWLPTGAAGGAWLHPAPDVELIFDRSTGVLCRLAVSAGKPGASAVVSDAAASFLTAVFGPAAARTVTRVAASHRSSPGLVAPSASLAALSDLACLRAARETSPISAAAWWDAEEAQLAEVAGLHLQARNSAAKAVRALAKQPLPALSERPAAVAHAAARIAAADEPAAARKVRALAASTVAAVGQESVPSLPPVPAATVANRETEAVTGIEVGWALDPGLVPDGIFVPALSPEDDLIVAPGAGGRSLVIEAQLASGAARGDLSQCRARLVVPAGRRLIAEGSFSWPGPRVAAELDLQVPSGDLAGAWIEIVGDELRPVRGTELRYLRRALRWGDAAVRAEQRPRGLAPGFSSDDWTAFAAIAWRRCWQDWIRAGDKDRAYLAARRLARYHPTATVPTARSEWAARLADHPRRERPASIAEEDGA
jgi:hypothetical protein